MRTEANAVVGTILADLFFNRLDLQVLADCLVR
jgi:hypothetical protein